MDMHFNGDLASLDAELLQLPEQEVSPLTSQAIRDFAEKLFDQWLSLPETSNQVKYLLYKAKRGRSLHVSGAADLPALGSPKKLVKDPGKELIPQFYFQNGRPPSQELLDECLSGIKQFFPAESNGLQIQEFKRATKEICKLPSFFSTALFTKIDVNCTGIVTRDTFVDYWIIGNMLTKDIAAQIYTILKQPNLKYLTQDDFKPVLRELLATHPGLQFLQSTPQFQDKYVGKQDYNHRFLAGFSVSSPMAMVMVAFILSSVIVVSCNKSRAETVTYRIFYDVNRSNNNRITLRELKRSNLIAAMKHVDEQLNVNTVLRYFSYEHFYVIFNTFVELDPDVNFLINKENLIKYGGFALTNRIVDRIFSQVPRKFTSKVEGKMGYEDFAYFILSEEDKSSETSLEYWFKCIDLDANGVITRNEMQYFYEDQKQRMEHLGRVPVPFEKILCQIVDMINPQDKGYFTLRDIKGSKLSGSVFNILFNTKKFLDFEKRHNSVLISQARENPNWTEWDHFAHREYILLSTDNVSSGSIYWDGSDDDWDAELDDDPPFSKDAYRDAENLSSAADQQKRSSGCTLATFQ
ncbi:unnamed protein product [Fraxinus pennsylvanica]|uniref:EF-hand domain-containing protein n=1 Tax=Fraxinus pennsylvanica TaxID=56036 RepID=A0AAD1ZEI3_9LAMI|nr:unnamed protein product [Fraxinus pennsylvanica]